jgi:hypothetical protein
VKTYTLPYFSKFKPYIQYLVVNLENNPELRIDASRFKIPLDPNHELLSIVDVLRTQASYFVNNYPYNPFPSWGNLDNYLLKVMKSLTTIKYSIYNFTWQYYRPDTIQILPAIDESYYIIKGAFVHTFDTIHTNWEREFLDLALADIYDYIASLRVKYQSYTTPYGDINLNWDYFQNRANDLRQKVMEKLGKTRFLRYCYVR